MTFATQRKLKQFLEEEGIYGYDEEIIEITDRELQYQNEQLQKIIEGLEIRIEKFTELAKQSRIENNQYSEGRRQGSVDAFDYIRQELIDLITPWDE